MSKEFAYALTPHYFPDYCRRDKHALSLSRGQDEQRDEGSE